MKYRFIFFENGLFSFLRLSSIILFCLLTNCLSGQTCLPSGITFTTQQQIDDFATDYPGCTEILGEVFIEGDTGTEILNLNGLTQIESIGDNLSIFNNDTLLSLSGLENVNSIV